MGVMNCSIWGCDDIMCHTYIEDIGYICRSCQDKFKSYLENKGIKITSRRQLFKELEKFRDGDLDINTSSHNTIDVELFFKKHTNY